MRRDSEENLCCCVFGDILYSSVLDVLNDATNLDKRMIDIHKCFGVK